MAVDPVWDQVATRRLKETEWKALENHDWFSYNHVKDKIIVWPAGAALACRSASGVEVREGGQLEMKPMYREEFANCGISLK